LTNFVYSSLETWTTPAHGFGGANVSFTLASNVREVVANCGASSSQIPSFFNGYQWYPCKFPDAALPSDQAWFKFTTTTGKVEVNQTYTCDGAGTLIRFTAYGFNSTTLDCKTDNYTNPNWNPNGSIYQSTSTDCAPASLDIVSSEISAIA
ncbi:hypothetical protein EJ04DRAFT_425166, partial [Polyplosphaeria fusca]